MQVIRASVALLLAVAAWPAAARDDFLRPTTRDLNAREKISLEECVQELGDGDPKLRRRAVRRMVAIGQPAMPALLDVLRRSSDAKQVRNACLAFGAIGDATAVAQLERWFLDDARAEEPSRAALLALARGRGPLIPEFSATLRRLVTDASLATVRESAVLCAAARKIPGLAALLKAPLQVERSARLRSCMLVALGESGDPAAPALVARFLDGRQVRDEKLRRAALCATARLGDPILLQPLLAFQPDRREISDYAVALGAFSEPAVVGRLGELMLREREQAVAAVASLAHIATPESKAWLERALQGDFSEESRAAAALCVSDLVDQQRFLPHLRTIALGPAAHPAKSAALLSLARIGDREAAGAVADALPLWRDTDLFQRGLLFCAMTLDRPLAEVVPQHRRDDVAELWRDASEIERGDRHRDLLLERVASELTAARAHWLLVRDDQRTGVLRELLDLDRDFLVEQRAQDGTGGGSPTPPPPSGGAGDGGDGGDPPDPAPEGDPPAAGGAPGSGLLPGNGGRRGRFDPTRFEHDLRAWLVDYSPFDVADPFAR
ncbi:MAG: hypothetical protein EXS13_07560 [Planctomycetes bacterium]|nr:hypothetical protein [Planctomycetota bacterium]